MLVQARSDAAVAARTSRSVRVASGSVEAWLLVGVTALGAVLRFATLGSQSYWFDEAQAAHELHLSFGSMVSSMVVHETNPPLYFVFGWLWARVFGTGEVGLRSLSALLGTAVIPIAYLCGRELVSRRAGLLAAAFAALSPFMIWYSQEAREYMLLVALSGASLLYFARSWNAPSTRNIALWGLFSALAVLTHFFAGFLVAPEALWLLYVIRNRAIAYAAGAVVVVQLSLVPLLASQAGSTLLGFIAGTRLATRVQQVPVAFGLGNLYQSPGARYGLLGAALLVGAVIALLLIGSDSRALRGAGAAAALAAVVLLLPLLLALVGKDYYIPRALMPAWIPLAVVVAAACTAPRARVAGAVLAVILLASFVYAQVKVSDSPQYQRPDWRGVATALGPASGTRAIVAYDGSLATDPLATYLPRVPWTEPTNGAATFGELDVVGYRWQTVGRPLPAGARLISSNTVDDFVVDRFALEPSRTLTRAQVAATAGSLLSPPVIGAAVLVQNSPSAR
jgi:mannosyltransferase